MILYQYILKMAGEFPVETSRKAAAEFLSKLIIPFDSSAIDLRAWKRNIAALRWLVNARENPKPPAVSVALAPPDQAPQAVRAVVDQYLSGIRIEFPWSTASFTEWREQSPEIRFVNAKGIVCRMWQNIGDSGGDQQTFWQAVFLSFVNSRIFDFSSVCQGCGDPLPATKQLGKRSRQALCNKCRQRKWRETHLKQAKRREWEKRTKRRRQS